ncbi:hypothetical protein LIA77_05915 [Sarocladium implicatum]|nr:hypothetical protein LIA77_05915 [Sarocladium implicatum]
MPFRANYVTTTTDTAVQTIAEPAPVTPRQWHSVFTTRRGYASFSSCMRPWGMLRLSNETATGKQQTLAFTITAADWQTSRGRQTHAARLTAATLARAWCNASCWPILTAAKTIQAT